MRRGAGRTPPPSPNPPGTPLQDHEGWTQGAGRWQLPPRPASSTREHPEPQVNASLRWPPHGLRNKIERSEEARTPAKTPGQLNRSPHPALRARAEATRDRYPATCAHRLPGQCLRPTWSCTQLPCSQEMPCGPTWTAAAMWPMWS